MELGRPLVGRANDFEVAGTLQLRSKRGGFRVGLLLNRVLLMAYFYEIRSSTNAVLKRDGGFADVEAGCGRL